MYLVTQDIPKLRVDVKLYTVSFANWFVIKLIMDIFSFKVQTFNWKKS